MAIDPRTAQLNRSSASPTGAATTGKEQAALVSRTRAGVSRFRRMHGIENERGAAIVEFAVISIILVILLLGVIEGGLAFRAKLSVANSADEGARRGAVAARDPFADYEVLQQIKAHSIAPETIETIVIYKADNSTSPPPDACKISSSAALGCNHYTASDLIRPRSDFGQCNGLDGAWCPTDRSTDLRTGDLLGVWIDADFDSPSGALGSIDFVETSILPLESKGQ